MPETLLPRRLYRRHKIFPREMPIMRSRCLPFCPNKCRRTHHPLLLKLNNISEEADESPLKDIKHSVKKFYRKYPQDHIFEDEGDNCLYPLLHWTCVFGKPTVTEYLLNHLSHNPSMKAPDKQETALHRTVLCLHIGMGLTDEKSSIDDVIDTFLKIAELLEDTLHCQDDNRDTPLHKCASYIADKIPSEEDSLTDVDERRAKDEFEVFTNYMIIMMNIIKVKKMNDGNSANIYDMKNSEGNTVLHILCRATRNSYPLEKVLRSLSKRCNSLHIRNTDGETPIDILKFTGVIDVSAISPSTDCTKGLSIKGEQSKTKRKIDDSVRKSKICDEHVKENVPTKVSKLDDNVPQCNIAGEQYTSNYKKIQVHKSSQLSTTATGGLKTASNNIKNPMVNKTTVKQGNEEHGKSRSNNGTLPLEVATSKPKSTYEETETYRPKRHRMIERSNSGKFEKLLKCVDSPPKRAKGNHGMSLQRSTSFSPPPSPTPKAKEAVEELSSIPLIDATSITSSNALTGKCVSSASLTTTPDSSCLTSKSPVTVGKKITDESKTSTPVPRKPITALPVPLLPTTLHELPATKTKSTVSGHSTSEAKENNTQQQIVPAKLSPPCTPVDTCKSTVLPRAVDSQSKSSQVLTIERKVCLTSNAINTNSKFHATSTIASLPSKQLTASTITKVKQTPKKLLQVKQTTITTDSTLLPNASQETTTTSNQPSSGNVKSSNPECNDMKQASGSSTETCQSNISSSSSVSTKNPNIKILTINATCLAKIRSALSNVSSSKSTKHKDLAIEVCKAVANITPSADVGTCNTENESSSTSIPSVTINLGSASGNENNNEKRQNTVPTPESNRETKQCANSFGGSTYIETSPMEKEGKQDCTDVKTNDPQVLIADKTHTNEETINKELNPGHHIHKVDIGIEQANKASRKEVDERNIISKNSTTPLSTVAIISETTVTNSVCSDKVSAAYTQTVIPNQTSNSTVAKPIADTQTVTVKEERHENIELITTPVLPMLPNNQVSSNVELSKSKRKFSTGSPPNSRPSTPAPGSNDSGMSCDESIDDPMIQPGKQYGVEECKSINPPRPKKGIQSAGKQMKDWHKYSNAEVEKNTYIRSKSNCGSRRESIDSVTSDRCSSVESSSSAESGVIQPQLSEPNTTALVSNAQAAHLAKPVQEPRSATPAVVDRSPMISNDVTPQIISACTLRNPTEVRLNNSHQNVHENMAAPPDLQVGTALQQRTSRQNTQLRQINNIPSNPSHRSTYPLQSQVQKQPRLIAPRLSQSYVAGMNTNQPQFIVANHQNMGFSHYVQGSNVNNLPLAMPNLQLPQLQHAIPNQQIPPNLQNVANNNMAVITSQGSHDQPHNVPELVSAMQQLLDSKMNESTKIAKECEAASCNEALAIQAFNNLKQNYNVLVQQLFQCKEKLIEKQKHIAYWTKEKNDYSNQVKEANDIVKKLSDSLDALKN